ncbi:MAG: hypothetical protein ACO1PI_03815 [Bacteroidota bacterium]
MPDTPPERTYKHQVPAEVFVEAFTTRTWTPAQTKKFNVLGIVMNSYTQIKNRTDSVKAIFSSETDEILLKEFELSHDFIVVDNIEITDEIYINDINAITERSKNWIFDTCNIGSINLINLKPNNEVDNSNEKHGKFSFYFYKCDLKSISIRSTELRTLHLGSSNLQSINLDKGSVVNLRLINNTKIVNNITVNAVKIGTIEVDGSHSEKLNIQKNSIIETIKITNKSTTSDIRISDNVEVNKIIAKNCELGFLVLKYSVCIFLSFEKVKSSLHLQKSSVDNIVINGSTLSVLEVDDKQLKELFIRGGVIYVLDFSKYTLKKEAVVSISNVKIHSCIMDEFNVLGILYLRDIGKIEDNFNENTLVQNIAPTYNKDNPETLPSCKERLQIKDPTFRINFSSLGKTEFTECDLEGFDFEFNNSKITDVFISGGTVPKKVNEKDLEQKKSFFDQLKKVFEGQGDIVRGTKYHARASEIQMKILWKQKNIAELLVYVLNWLSNKHGESWLRGLLFTIVISLIGFYFYNNTLAEDYQYQFVWKWNTDYIGDWAQFILPTHRVDFMVDNPCSTTKFIDVIFRVFIGYGIYQLISAFRKHGKRG